MEKWVESDRVVGGTKLYLCLRGTELIVQVNRCAVQVDHAHPSCPDRHHRVGVGLQLLGVLNQAPIENPPGGRGHEHRRGVDRP